MKCAASVKELHSKWEAAKTMYREKVSEVESETEDWLRTFKGQNLLFLWEAKQAICSLQRELVGVLLLGCTHLARDSI